MCSVYYQTTKDTPRKEDVDTQKQVEVSEEVIHPPVDMEAKVTPLAEPINTVEGQQPGTDNVTLTAQKNTDTSKTVSPKAIGPSCHVGEPPASTGTDESTTSHKAPADISHSNVQDVKETVKETITASEPKKRRKSQNKAARAAGEAGLAGMVQELKTKAEEEQLLNDPTYAGWIPPSSQYPSAVSTLPLPISSLLSLLPCLSTILPLLILHVSSASLLSLHHLPSAYLHLPSMYSLHLPCLPASPLYLGCLSVIFFSLSSTLPSPP